LKRGNAESFSQFLSEKINIELFWNFGRDLQMSEFGQFDTVGNFLRVVALFLQSILGVKSKEQVLSDFWVGGYFLNSSNAKHSPIVGLQLAAGRRIFQIDLGCQNIFENFKNDEKFNIIHLKNKQKYSPCPIQQLAKTARCQRAYPGSIPGNRTLLNH
jgi:hypothetical protein